MRSSVRRSDYLFLAVLLVLSGYFSYLHWSKIPSFWGDSARWIFETYRVFLGDTPYRDIASVYPPLSLYAFAGVYKLFGQTFATAQVLVDLLSVALLVSTYALGRLFMSAGLSAAVVFCLTLAGASSDSSFALFGLSIYTPSILIACVGLNLFLIALIKALRSQALRLPHTLLATLGCTLSILSRIEFAVAMALCMGLVLLSLWNRQMPSALRLLCSGVIVIAPTLLVFGTLIGGAGIKNVAEGIANYGSSSMVCPYWPTGLGLLGFVAGLSEGVLLYVLGTLLSRETFGRSRYKLFGVALAASLVTGVYIYSAWSDFPRYWAVPTLQSFSRSQTLSSLISLTHLLVAPMSLAVVLTAATLCRAGVALAKGQSLRAIVMDDAVLYAAGAALALRSLFGTLWTEIPAVSPSAYTTLFLISGVLLSKAFSLPKELAATWRGMICRCIPICLFLTYGLARLSWYYHAESGAAYYPLDTLAGGVLVNSKASVDVYNYVVANTRADDFVADVAYGGGVNFAARRPGPLFMTMFSFLMPSERTLMDDLERIKRSSPALVIGEDTAHLGTQYGGGTTNGCMFPRFVWRSTRISGNAEKRLPVISFVEANYTRVLKSGSFVVLAPRNPPGDRGRDVGTGR